MDVNDQISDALGLMASNISQRQQATKNDFLMSYLRGQPGPQTFAEGAGMPLASMPTVSQQQPRPSPAMQPQAMPPATQRPYPTGRPMTSPAGGPPQNPVPAAPHPGMQPTPVSAGPAQGGQPVDALGAQYDDLMKRRAAASAEEERAYAPPDRSKAEEAYKQHVAGGDAALMRALAAQQAGPGFAPMQQQFMQQYEQARAPMKTAGGTYTPEGFIEDVDRVSELNVKRLQARISQYDQLLNSNITAQERARIASEKQASEKQLRELMVGTQLAIAQAASADRRYQADLAHADRQAAAAAKGAGGKGTVDPQHLIDLVGEARTHLKNATGSGAGALVDTAAGFFGHSTEGAQATARLNAIGGQLVMAQPRMEGPQSDADVKLYRQMAGDVANDKLPIATRAAALDTIETLSKKYQSGEFVPAGKQTGSTSGTWGPPQSTGQGPLRKARAAAQAGSAAGAPEVSFGSLK